MRNVDVEIYIIKIKIEKTEKTNMKSLIIIGLDTETKDKEEMKDKTMELFRPTVRIQVKIQTKRI